MADTKHSELAGVDMHSPYRAVFADEAARLAYGTTAVAADVGKMYKQTDDAGLYELTAIGPAVWQQVGGVSTPGGGGLDVLSEITTDVVITEITAVTGLSDAAASIVHTGSFLVGAVWDGTHYWLLDGTTGVATQFDAAGATTGTTYSLGVASTLQGIAWDGTHFYTVSSSTNMIYKYTAAGVYTGTSFDVSANSTSTRDIVHDGSHLWVIDYITDRAYKYTTAGVYTGTSFYVGEQEITPEGLTWDGSSFWMVGGSEIIYQYTAGGAYTGVSYSASALESSGRALAWDGTHLLFGGSSSDKMHKLNKVTGPEKRLTSDKLGLLVEAGDTLTLPDASVVTAKLVTAEDQISVEEQPAVATLVGTTTRVNSIKDVVSLVKLSPLTYGLRTP